MLYSLKGCKAVKHKNLPHYDISPPQELVAGVRDNSNTRNCGFVEMWSMLLYAFSHQWTRIGEEDKLYPTRNLVPDHVVKHLVLFRKFSS